MPGVIKRIALVGNPNCGKTTVFNALTGSRQKVGNWPGVTVECKSGVFTSDESSVEVIDLPGMYSLVQADDEAAIDERIAVDFIHKQSADVIVNILDASQLERHLYLTTQLLELGMPLVIVLNMMDVAEGRAMHIDVAQLSQQLGCPVIPLQATRGLGIKALMQAVLDYPNQTWQPVELTYPKAVMLAIKALIPCSNMLKDKSISNKVSYLALRLLENDKHMQTLVSDELLAQVAVCQQDIQLKAEEDADILIADTRYSFIETLLQKVMTRNPMAKPTWTSRLDRVILHRFFGIPIFLFIMYCLFVFAINVGGAFQDFFDISSQTIFVDGVAHLLNQISAPTWLIALLADGIGKGINTTVTFIPVLGAMFLFLAILEDSGYMARAAFIVDRLMRALGLPGKAFVPMIVGFGCNVPAVMGARSLENKRDRILTIMMAPFMSCGARLAIFAIFTTAFFPHGGQNIVFALYLMGIFMAVLTGLFLRHTVLQGEPSPLIMELPAYHWPQTKSLLMLAWYRLKAFIFRAGRMIVPICVLIGALNAINIDGTLNTQDANTQSLLSYVGRLVTPIFSPMGISADNWPATVGLVTGVLAKEVVVGTLNSLYAQVGHLASLTSASDFNLWSGLSDAIHSVPQNVLALRDAVFNPVTAQAPFSTMQQGVYGLMAQRFDGGVGAFAYLMFVLLYFPCVSTMAVMMRELNRAWAIFSGLWMTAVAYGAAVFFYQAATWFRHPWSSSLWMGGMIFVFVAFIVIAKRAMHDGSKLKAHRYDFA